MYKLIFKLSLILALLGSVTVVTANRYLASKILLEKREIFHITKNQSLSCIITKLSDKGLINKPTLMKYSLRILMPNIRFQQGEYMIQPSETLFSIIDKFSKGIVLRRKFTIVEGSTVKYTKHLLDREESLTGNIIEAVNEGFLYPDTYYFTYGQDRNELLKKMQSEMKNALTNLYNERQDNYLKLEEVITLASIVEKETQLPEERPRVAAVFLNRLKKKMRLQADPTIIYALSNEMGYLDRNLNLKDLQSDSLYNTYKIAALPPTAISIPSIASIKAVLSPMETEDLYFVANNKGGHCFAKNLLTHNIHVIKYRSNTKFDCK